VALIGDYTFTVDNVAGALVSGGVALGLGATVSAVAIDV